MVETITSHDPVRNLTTAMGYATAAYAAGPKGYGPELTDEQRANLSASLNRAAESLNREHTEHDEHEAGTPGHEDTAGEHEATPAIAGHLPVVIAMRAFDTHEDLGTIHVPITTATPRPAGSIPFGVGVTHADVRRAVTEHLGLDPRG